MDNHPLVFILKKPARHAEQRVVNVLNLGRVHHDKIEDSLHDHSEETATLPRAWTPLRWTAHTGWASTAEKNIDRGGFIH